MKFLTFICIISSCYAYKTIAVFGGAGRTGREVVNYCLDSGFRTISFSRNPHLVTAPPRLGGGPFEDQTLLRHVKGDSTNLDDVKTLFDLYKPDGVVIALGGSDTCLSTRNIISCMDKRDAISVVSSMGVGESKEYPPLFFKVLLATFLRNIHKDKERQQELFTSTKSDGSTLRYHLLKPSGLTDDHPSDIISIHKNNYMSDKRTYQIPRANVAELAVNILEKDDPSILSIESLSNL